MTVPRTVLLTAVAAVLVAGCGAPSPAGPAPAVPVSRSPEVPVRPAPPAPTVDVRIAGRTVSPTGTQLQASVGQPIVVRVDSDVADEMHVHSVPEHTFAVEARPGQSFRFTVDVPGVVAVELHELDRTIATVRVR